MQQRVGSSHDFLIFLLVVGAKNGDLQHRRITKLGNDDGRVSAMSTTGGQAPCSTRSANGGGRNSQVTLPKPRQFKPSLEPLEGREVPAIVSWVGFGNWDMPGNWSTGQVPIPGVDDVVFDAGYSN